MESAISKKNAIAAMADKAGTPELRTRAGILVSLIEIREAIEQGFAKLDQTHTDGAAILDGCKESFDGYVQTRLEADKTLSGLYASIWSKRPENDEEPDGPAERHLRDSAHKAVNSAISAKPPEDEEKLAGPTDAPKKSSVTLDVGDFGGPGRESGIA